MNLTTFPLLVSVTAIFLLGAMRAEAARPTYNYLCVAKMATNVAVAEPVSVSQRPVISGIPFDFFAVKFKVKKNIKGVLEKQGVEADYIELLWARDAFHSARYLIGSDYLLFLRGGENGLYVINGPQGAQKLERGKWNIYGQTLSLPAVGRFVEIGEQKATGCPTG